MREQLTTFHTYHPLKHCGLGYRIRIESFDAAPIRETSLLPTSAIAQYFMRVERGFNDSLSIQNERLINQI